MLSISGDSAQSTAELLVDWRQRQRATQAVCDALTLRLQQVSDAAEALIEMLPEAAAPLKQLLADQQQQQPHSGGGGHSQVDHVVAAVPVQQPKSRFLQFVEEVTETATSKRNFKEECGVLRLKLLAMENYQASLQHANAMLIAEKERSSALERRLHKSEKIADEAREECGILRNALDLFRNAQQQLEARQNSQPPNTRQPKPKVPDDFDELFFQGQSSSSAQQQNSADAQQTSELEAELSKVRKQLSEHNIKLAELSSQWSSSRAEVVSLRHALEQLSVREQTAVSQIRELKDIVAGLQSADQASLGNITRLENERDHLRACNHNLEQQLRRVCGTLSEIRDSGDLDRVKVLETCVKEKDAAMALLQEQIDALKAEVSDRSEALGEAVSEKNKLAGLLADSQRMIGSLEVQLEAADGGFDSIAALEADLRRIKTWNSELQQGKEKQKAEFDRRLEFAILAFEEVSLAASDLMSQHLASQLEQLYERFDHPPATRRLCREVVPDLYGEMGSSFATAPCSLNPALTQPAAVIGETTASPPEPHDDSDGIRLLKLELAAEQEERLRASIDNKRLLRTVAELRTALQSAQRSAASCSTPSHSRTPSTAALEAKVPSVTEAYDPETMPENVAVKTENNILTARVAQMQQEKWSLIEVIEDLQLRVQALESDVERKGAVLTNLVAAGHGQLILALSDPSGSFTTGKAPASSKKRSGGPNAKNASPSSPIAVNTADLRGVQLLLQEKLVENASLREEVLRLRRSD